MGIRFVEKLLTFFFDVVAFNVALACSFWLRYKSGLFPEAYNPELTLGSYFTPGLILTAGWIVLFFFSGLYREWYKESRLDEFFVVARTVVFGMFLLFLATRSPEIIEFARTGNPAVLFTHATLAIHLTYGGFMLFFATLNRFTMHTILSWLFARGVGVSKVVIVGATESGEDLAREIARYPKLGYRVAGFVDDDGRKKGTEVGGLTVFGTYSDIPSVARREGISGLVISHVSTSANEIMKVIEYCGDLRLTIYVAPSLMDVISGHLKTHQLFGVPLMVLLQDHMPAWEAQIKRVLDMLAALTVLGLGAPLWLMLAAAIRLGSKGPAIYQQERAGQYGKVFTVYKFRSMYEDAEQISGPQWAQEKDPRITPIGGFLRKSRLDEIPQFINVLKGEMSLVGPRPERPFFIEQLKRDIPWYVRRLKMKPGITGWAQVKHKYDASIEDVKQKVIYDLYYFENMSIALDMKIILRSVIVVLTGKGAR